MKISANLVSHLEQLDVSFCIDEIDSALLSCSLKNRKNRNTKIVYSTLLQSDEEHFIAIFSEDTLFNPELISEHLGKIVRAAPADLYARMLESRGGVRGLEGLLAIQQSVDCKIVVDSNLLEAQQLYLYSGTDNCFLVVDIVQFEKLISGSLHLPFTIPLIEIKRGIAQPEHDADSLNQAIRKYTSLSIQRLLTDTLRIPPLPTNASKIIKLSANSNASAEQLIAIVELDPSLAAQVISWAASPYYSVPGVVDSIKDAIVRVLGYDLVMNLALGLAMGRLLGVPKEASASIGDFWRQSVYCALLMEKLNRKLPAKQRGGSGLTYLVGLLNNFGYLVLLHAFPTYFSTLSQYLEPNRHLSHVYVEHYLLGICREQISSQLLQVWGLPEEVFTALRYQSDDTYVGDHHRYANLCLVSKGLLATRGVGAGATEFIPARVYQQLGLQPTDAEAALAEIFESEDQIDAMTSVFSS